MNETLPPHDSERPQTFTPQKTYNAPSGMPRWAKVVVGILAIIGGLTLLLAAACFGMIVFGR